MLAIGKLGCKGQSSVPK